MKEIKKIIATFSCDSGDCCSEEDKLNAETTLEQKATVAEDAEAIKAMVKEKYSAIASQSKLVNQASCCGATSACSTVDYTVFADDYTQMEGYNKEADLGLGCGLPTEFAKISKGDTVVDLGSGAGNDCFVARAETGEAGRVVGIDMTEKMIEQARKNVSKLGFDNVGFILGELEDIPLEADFADVVVSNCVFNLVPDKRKAFQETHRILKPGGHFSISDVVIRGELPAGLKNDAELYAGCVSGAIDQAEYLNTIEQAGFKNIQVQKEKEILLPKEILRSYLSEKGIEVYNASNVGIYSITVYAEK